MKSKKMLKMLPRKFIFIIAFIVLAQTSWANTFITPYGDKIKLRMALTPEAQSKGLSGVKPQEFGEDEGMLFVYEKSGPRRFWMPDTYFNLDIYFLDAQYIVVAVEKNVPFHPGRQEPPLIYQTKTYEAQHVLEMKSSSKISKKIKKGDRFKLQK